MVDSLALKLADKHNGLYTSIYTFALVPGMLAPLVGGLLVDDYDPEFGTKADYRKLFLTQARIFFGHHFDQLFKILTVQVLLIFLKARRDCVKKGDVR